MQDQQLFSGDPVVMTMTATRQVNGTWTLCARVLREYQSYNEVPVDVYPELSARELEELLCVIAERSLIL